MTVLASLTACVAEPSYELEVTQQAEGLISISRDALPVGSSVTPGGLLPGVAAPELSAAIPFAKRWDFEDGTLQGFQHEEVPAVSHRDGAFYNQPTFGDNVSASRALDTSAMVIADPCAGLVLDERTTCEFSLQNSAPYWRELQRDLTAVRAGLDGVGGDFWNTPFPIGKQGHYWIGTAENRPSREIDPRSVPTSSLVTPQRWGTTQSNSKTGRILSPEFAIHHKYFHLLVGGGCSSQVGVYLQVLSPIVSADALMPPGIKGVTVPIGLDGSSTKRSDPIVRYEWLTARDKAGKPIVARGACVENMARVAFDISHLVGTKRARIAIEDRATGAWGHINVDDINLTDRAPEASSRSKDPIWGVADLHAHLMNEKAFTAFASDGRTPDAKLLWGSALGPLDGMGGCNDTHTMSYDVATGSHYTLCRDMCLNLMEGAGLKPEGGGAFDGNHHDTNGGFPFFHAWPMFYSAAHQQMHWTWVRRAFEGGLRMMIATVGNSEVLSFSLVKEKDRAFTSDQDALATQIPAIKEFARQNSSWCEVAYTPQDARRIANSGKLALLIGIELDHVMDSCNADVTRLAHHTARENAHPYSYASAKGLELDVASGLGGAATALGVDTRVVHHDGHPRTCTPAQIEGRLAALYDQGVRHVIPMHFSDNMLGGYAVTSDMFVASAVFGSPDAQPPRFGTAAEARGIDLRLQSIQAPVWLRLDPTALVDGDLIEPGIARTVLDFFSGDCIEDMGWRVALGILTGGLSEANCAARTVTTAAFNAARDSMPYEGATDSPLMLSFRLPAAQRELPGHVNGLGLTDDGRLFLRAMKRRGMLIDLQHASEKAKNDMLSELSAYPAMASHGGVQAGATRATENVLSREQARRVYTPPGGFKGGLVGLGAQSSRAVGDQLRLLSTDGAGPSIIDHEMQVQSRGVALGTDINGIDWHAAPRFGRWAFPRESAEARRARVVAARDGGVGLMVRYQAYPASTSPHAGSGPDCAGCTWPSRVSDRAPLRPLQITRGPELTRTFDINFDGLAHFGMVPDFLQEVANGTSAEHMGMVFRSAESLVQMWEESCYLAYRDPAPPAHILRGCGPRSNYE